MADQKNSREDIAERHDFGGDDNNSLHASKPEYSSKISAEDRILGKITSTVLGKQKKTR
jgi:hypothetical protein